MKPFLDSASFSAEDDRRLGEMAAQFEEAEQELGRLGTLANNARFRQQ